LRYIRDRIGSLAVIARSPGRTKKVRVACKAGGAHATNPDCFSLVLRNERADTLPGVDQR